MTLNSQLALFCSLTGTCLWTNWFSLHHTDHIMGNGPGECSPFEQAWGMGWGGEGGWVTMLRNNGGGEQGA